MSMSPGADNIVVAVAGMEVLLFSLKLEFHRNLMTEQHPFVFKVFFIG